MGEFSDYQIERLAIWPEIEKIIRSGKKNVTNEYRGMLHTEKEDIPILKIISIDAVRDYVNNIGDYVIVEFKMALGDYAMRMFPFRNNLEFSIKKIPLKEVFTVQDPDYKIEVTRYKAVFMMDQNPIINATELEQYDSESLNKVKIIDVKLQLLDRSLEPLRIKMVNGIYRNFTQKQLIHSMIGGQSMNVIVDGKPSIDGIDIVEPDNKEVIKHSIIPDGIHLINLTSYLQEEMNGVYNSGIGTYLQTYNKKKIWFVYSLFDFKRFNEDKNKIIFYSVTQEKLPSMNRTFRKENNTIHAIVTAGRKYQDSAEADYMNYGVGFRTSDARPYMNKPVSVTLQGPVGNRRSLNHEVSIHSRKDGLDYMPVSSRTLNANKFMAHRGISNNPFVDYSNVNARNTGRFDITWEMCDDTLIHPGMPCKYVYMDKTKLVELRGVVLFVHSFTSLYGNGVTNKSYKTMCVVTIATEKYKEKNELPKIKPHGIF